MRPTISDSALSVKKRFGDAGKTVFGGFIFLACIGVLVATAKAVTTLVLYVVGGAFALNDFLQKGL
jgi:amino acid permease